MKESGAEMERLFLALSDWTRLRLLNLMGEDEVCVCFFVEVLGEGQPKISRHLAYLRRAGIVGARRDGRWMHYRVLPPANVFAARILGDVQAWLQEEEQMQSDRARLVSLCSATCSVPHLIDAPRPLRLASNPCLPE